MKVFEDNSVNVAQMMEYVLNWAENIVEKEEKAAYQDFHKSTACGCLIKD